MDSGILADGYGWGKKNCPIMAKNEGPRRSITFGALPVSLIVLLRDYGECGLRYHQNAAGVKAKGFHAPAASTWANTKGPWGSRNPGPFLAFVGLFS